METLALTVIIIILILQHFRFSGVQVADMLLELCVTELEDVATDSQSGRLSSQPVVVESSHPYTDDTSTSGTVKIPGEDRGGGAYRRSKCLHKSYMNY